MQGEKKDFPFFILFYILHTDIEVKENDWNLNMKEFFTIKSTILYIYLLMSVKNHWLLWNTTNYIKKEKSS